MRKIKHLCEELISILENNDIKNNICDLLVEYQPIRVTKYEIERCLYTLQNIDKIKEYLTQVIDKRVCSFLPSNLPLYSLLLFVIMPGFITQRVVVRPNTELVKQGVIETLCKILEFKELFPNIEIFKGTRECFVEYYIKDADLIIFTGRNETKNKVREFMKPESYMINNGSGHNPIIVAEGADINLAAKDITYVKFFNAGQDCAGPDAVFVHENIAKEFIKKLKEKISNLKIGDHSDPEVIVGKIHRTSELEKFQKIFHDNRKKILIGGKIDLEKKVVEPTLIVSKIEYSKLNYKEIFGPILFIYTYQHDGQLPLYFKDKDGKYVQNKMYVSFYGKSEYLKFKNDSKFIQEKGSSKGGVGISLETIIHNIENGTVAYGGHSNGASSILYKDIDEKFYSKATPILINKIIHDYFVNNQKLNESLNSGRKLRKKIRRNFTKKVYRTFKDNLEFAFIFGSVAKKTFRFNSSDVDTFICLNSKDEKSFRDFKSWSIKLQCKVNLKPDLDYPAEITTSDMLFSWIYQLNLELGFSNSRYWIDDNKLDCSFTETFKCDDSETYDAVFLLSVIASPYKFALLVSNSKALKSIELAAEKIINKIIEKILINIVMLKDIPEHLEKMFPKHSGMAIEHKLKEGDYDNNEVLRTLIKWPEPDKTKGSEVRGDESCMNDQKIPHSKIEECTLESICLKSMTI
ncbi:aldehyde dehydrogenase family protein [Wolbachia endosymbiont of Pentidionis agamae]|uniref:aldehyde dehydrogenase family protein n=1 Tax=Wolbachia endosymbiont of Pentidionis agamae TaxID=3110435 RepID=UPI002FD05EF8